MIRRLLCFMLLMTALVACDTAPQGGDNLPTVAQLPTATDTPLPSDTPIASETPTATETPTASPVFTETATVTPSATITDTPSPTPTDTPTITPEPRAVNALLELAMQATVLPQQVIATAVPPLPGDDSFLPTVPAVITCAFPPPGGFNAIYAGDPALNQQLGCPQGDPPAPITIEGAWQEFEGGFMLWLDGPVYVLYNGGRFQRFQDTYDETTDPESGGETPPPGRVEPVRGFGKVWRENPNVRQGLGWAYGAETGVQAVYQPFDRGLMLALPQRTQIIIIAADEASGAGGTWRSLVGSY